MLPRLPGLLLLASVWPCLCTRQAPAVGVGEVQGEHLLLVSEADGSGVSRMSSICWPPISKFRGRFGLRAHSRPFTVGGTSGPMGKAAPGTKG